MRVSPRGTAEQASDRVGAERARHGAGGRVAAAKAAAGVAQGVTKIKRTYHTGLSERMITTEEKITLFCSTFGVWPS